MELISGIGCNWLVASVVWLSYGTEDITGKILGICFPTVLYSYIFRKIFSKYEFRT